jgi:hypothetical protein
VGQRTLYDALPGEAALFGRTLGVALVGDEDPVAVADRAEIRAARDEESPSAAIGRPVGYPTDPLERAGDLILVSVEAAGSDPDTCGSSCSAHRQVTRSGDREARLSTERAGQRPADRSVRLQSRRFVDVSGVPWRPLATWWTARSAS